MSQVVSISLRGETPGCPPISCCAAGSPVSFQLKSESKSKGLDNSGWLVGVLTEDCVATSKVGPSDWIYRIAFPDEAITPGSTIAATDMATGTGTIGVCCLNCGDIMLLDMIASLDDSRSLHRESFQIFGESEPHLPGVVGMTRNHSAIEIYAIEASCEVHKVGYPYADDPGPVTLTFQNTPAHLTTPYAITTLATDGGPVAPSPLVIDPASSTPLTNRIEFIPGSDGNRLLVPAGARLGVEASSADPDAHCGLEVHIEFKIVEPPS